MTGDSIFKEQWTLLRKETEMDSAALQEKLEHFIFRQYGLMVLMHYIKALSILELSHRFYLRFRGRSRSLAESILYWTVLAETNIHMTLQGVKDEPPFIKPHAGTETASQLDMLKDCYLLYLKDRQHTCWPPDSRRSRLIRDKWNGPELEEDYFPGLCRNNTDRHYANIMYILLGETLHSLVSLRQIRNHGKNMLTLSREQYSQTPIDAPRPPAASRHRECAPDGKP